MVPSLVHATLMVAGKSTSRIHAVTFAAAPRIKSLGACEIIIDSLTSYPILHTMKAIPAAINRAMSCAPIRKRTMADVDLTPKPLPVRRKRKLELANTSSPRLFNFFA